MALATVNEILTRARTVYLNDPNGSQFDDTILLNYMKTAYDLLQSKMEVNDLSVKYSVFQKTVKAGDTDIGQLPPDFVWPLNLEERLAGSSDGFSPMIQRSAEPTGAAKVDTLLYWSFRLNGIKFIGALTDREVLLTYLSLFPEIGSISDNVFVSALPYLSAKISELAHRFISQNVELANYCKEIAEGEMSNLIRNYVKRSQAVPSSPVPYINTGWG